MNKTTPFIDINKPNSIIIKIVKEHKFILLELKHFINENIVVAESFKWPFIQQSPTNAL